LQALIAGQGKNIECRTIQPAKLHAKRRKSGADAGADVVAAQNGEDGGLSQSGAIIQAHWGAISSLASDVSTDETMGASVRRGVMALLEVVMR
jgi:hypothetical protein